MNVSARNAIRKIAIANGIRTSDWDDSDFTAYASAVRDSLPIHMVAELFGDDPMPAQDPPTPTPAPDDASATIAALQRLLGASMDEGRVRQLIAEHMGQPAPIIRQSVTVTAVNGSPVGEIDSAHAQLPLVLRYLSAGVNIQLIGPAGSGKSYMVKQCAKALGLDYYYQGAMQTESKVLGFMSATGEYVRTPFRDAFEHGGVFVLEEADSCHPRAMLALNNIIANDSGDFPDGIIAKHDNFRMVMACNTFGRGATVQYVGRQPLDESSLNRFRPIHIDYDENLERDIALSIDPDSGAWVDRVQSVRKRVMDAGLRYIISPRNTFDGVKLGLAGVDIQDVEYSCLFAGMSDDDVARVSQ